MSSAAEQLVRNFSFGAFFRSKEIRNRLLFTLGVLLLYRLGTYVPLPGVDPEIFASFFQRNQSGVLGLFNVFAGGAVGRMALFSLSLIPYITASIIIQLAVSAFPTLSELRKQGEEGQKKINSYSRYLTIPLALSQAIGIAITLESIGAALNPGWEFRIMTMITLLGAVMFLVWLGEQITVRGLGNGVSLIIFAGIVAEMPSALAGILELGRQGSIPTYFLPLFFVFFCAIVTFVVFMERSQRRLIVHYPRRQQAGGGMAEQQGMHLPLKINTAGVIPPIFASALLLMPLSATNFLQTSGWLATVTAYLGPGQPLYLALYALGIGFFCFFYTAIVFNPEDTADHLKRAGGFLPGRRPGRPTAEYIDYVLTRITVVGALYLILVCLLPELFISREYGGAVLSFFGGTSLLIVVSVTMDTTSRLYGYLAAQQYGSLLKKVRKAKKGRRRR